ncbi:hypothetical protein M595_3413 [Lyngbya aestuarii BL J]|uniref:Uncharacterized protein n=1 Tax=Lyngbya aestuarii BL J TaxID=1348334 RepID=U7QJP0_9CYAN|nr:hypothetical protein [Lyngbya aestuarii]ERT06641.1 hypothetical protein M595_3413 [Lyngbya aestuarii BL J]
MSQNYCNIFWRSLLIFPIIGLINLSDIPTTFAQSLPSPLETAVIDAVQQPGLPTPEVTKVTIEGLFGLATWVMGEAGGMVALINNGRNWEVTRLPGGVPDAEELSRLSGIPVEVCEELLSQHLGTK